MNELVKILFVWLIILGAFVKLNGQSLLSVQWHSNVSSNVYINHTYDIDTDENGNVYSLSSFPNQTNSFGQTFYESEGTYLLTKQDAFGNLLITTNFGGEDCFTFGDIEVNDIG